MAELTTAADATTANSCCAPEAQTTCCEPSAKVACCDPSHGDGCGCSAGKGADEAPARDIREQVRERYAAAAAQVTTTDPGAGCCAPSETFDGGSEVFGAALYALGDHEQLPDTAKLASLGCGNPTAVAELHEGETVLDLGSGGGIDVAALRQARRPYRGGSRAGYDRRDACPRPRERTEGRRRERRVPHRLHRGDPAP
jgi:arsenite methyltransferase